MNLTIDQGNSRTKVALFDESGQLKKAIVYKAFTSADVERLFSLYPIKASIISSVINIEPAVVNALHRLSARFVLFDHLTPLPIKNGYGTPQTLGLERLAAAVGAVSLCPNKNLLIIDAGSAITYDYISADGVFRGGNIAPGIKMRLEALHKMTQKLPLVEADENELIPLFGSNTRDAIKAGVIRGVSFEVKGYMRTLTERGEDFTTFLTGGHAPYILNTIRNKSIRVEKNLTLIGLNCILEHYAAAHL